LEPLLAFFAAFRPFAEVSRLTVVSKTWRRVSLNALKTAKKLILSGFAESVTDGVVRLALSRVASANLRLVDLSGCHNISAGGMEEILQYVADTCLCLKLVIVTACSNDAVLRAVAMRARAVFGVHSAQDLYTHLKLLKVHTEEVEEEQDEDEQADWKRYPFSYLGRLLHFYSVERGGEEAHEIPAWVLAPASGASTPLLLFSELAARKNALFQAAAHGTGSDVVMLLSLSFAVDDEDESDEGESDEDDIRTYDVNEEDSQGNSPLLLACRSGNFEIAEILVGAGANVSTANERGDTPLLVAVGAGRFEMFELLLEAKAHVNVINGGGASALHLAIASGSARSFEMFETLLKAGANVNVVRRDGASALQLAIVSENARSFEMFETLLKAGADVNVVRRDGASALQLAIVSGKGRSFEMFEALLRIRKGKRKANVNVINSDGASALHLAIVSDNARSFEMFEKLLKTGADVNVVRRDGASVLALAIVSGNARILNCRMMPKMIEYDESAEISYVRCLSLAFLEPNHIFRWLKDGRSARELLGVLCALMASAATERPIQDRLSHVRAFISCHVDLLQDPTPLAPLTVTDVVKQLLLQESDSVFDNTDPQWPASIERGVVWVNKPPSQHACRWTIQADRAVSSVAYSADGSRLARSEERDLVVCDAVSGFEVHRLKGHR
jgi:ankyrin repeat protein